GAPRDLRAVADPPPAPRASSGADRHVVTEGGPLEDDGALTDLGALADPRPRVDGRLRVDASQPDGDVALTAVERAELAGVARLAGVGLALDLSCHGGASCLPAFTCRSGRGEGRSRAERVARSAKPDAPPSAGTAHCHRREARYASPTRGRST